MRRKTGLGTSAAFQSAPAYIASVLQKSMQEKWKYALQLTRGREPEAKDLMQEACIKTIRFIENIENENKIQAYYVSALHTCAIDAHRNKRGRGTGLRTSKRYVNYGLDWTYMDDYISYADFDLTQQTTEKLTAEDRGKTNNILYKFIDQLPEDQKEMIVLFYFKKMKHKEIAALRNESINTCLGRLRYALAKLRKIMLKQNIKLTN